MAQGDLLLAGIASAMMKSATSATATPSGGTPTTGSSPVTATFSGEQIDQLAGALTEAVGRIQVPTPTVNFPSNLEVRFSDTELAKIASSISGSTTPSTRLIETRVLSLDFNGGIITNALFPTLQRVANYEFTQDYFLVAVSLSCSLVNITPDVSGLFFGRDLGERINIQQQSNTDTASDIFISQLTHQNSTLATISPLSRTNTVAFGGDTVFIPVQAGTKLAIYACGNNTVANFYTAVASIHVTNTQFSV
jgi:hypothetical protein